MGGLSVVKLPMVHVPVVAVGVGVEVALFFFVVGVFFCVGDVTFPLAVVATSVTELPVTLLAFVETGAVVPGLTVV